MLTSYNLYLIIYTLPKETRKMIEEEEPFNFSEEFEELGNSTFQMYTHLETNLHDNKNRFVVLNFNVGLYLGCETLQEIKNKFYEADIISKINPVDFKIVLDDKTKIEYNYLINKWVEFNQLQT
jgi:hypothetical protein